jgi:hypothetical protein
MRDTKNMAAPVKRSLIFGVLCSLVGILIAILIFPDAQGEGFQWFFIPAGLSAFLCGAALWRVLPERIPRHRLVWATLAGALSGLVSHYFTWYLVMLGANLCYWLTGGCTSSLGEPPVNLLEAVWGAAVFTFYSLLFVGWQTLIIGAGIGLIFALYNKNMSVDEN